jgi:hypothetical protein
MKLQGKKVHEKATRKMQNYLDHKTMNEKLQNYKEGLCSKKILPLTKILICTIKFHFLKVILLNFLHFYSREKDVVLLRDFSKATDQTVVLLCLQKNQKYQANLKVSSVNFSVNRADSLT